MSNLKEILIEVNLCFWEGFLSVWWLTLFKALNVKFIVNIRKISDFLLLFGEVLNKISEIFFIWL